MASDKEIGGKAGWSDVLFSEQPEPVVTYRTGWVVHEEALIKGRFVGRAWNGSGFVTFYDGPHRWSFDGDRINPGGHATPQAFWLEIDGQLLASDWEWAGFEKQAAKDGCGLHVIVTLRHRVRPVTVRVHTKLDGTPVLTRWLEVLHGGAQPAALGAVSSWSGVLQQTKRWRSHLGDRRTGLYSLGYFDNAQWGNEGDFQWKDLPAARYCVDGRYRRGGHRHPWFVLRNNATGAHFICQLAWSGGYCFEFDLEAPIGTTDQAAQLCFRAGPDAPAPQRILSPGETVATPEVHLGLVLGDLDATIQAMQDHLRKSVLMPPSRGRGGWVESVIGCELEITPEQVIHAIDTAADCGAEVFFIDASWHAPLKFNWMTTIGDWDVDRQRFPDGLRPFRERARQKGMLFGLWAGVEGIAEGSRVAKQHPDWVAAGYAGERLGLIDLTNPEAARWMESEIVRVIEENELEFFRLDCACSSLRTVRDGFVENGYWRYCETLYAIWDRMRARFPNVVFENCAGGGGRTDIGIMRRFDHTWISDWMIAPRSFAITNGMTMALPPERTDRTLGALDGFTVADFDFQSRLLLFSRPTFAYLMPPGAPWNPHMLARMKHAIGLYKDFARPFVSTGRIYHHTPVLAGPDPQGWGVLESVSGDRTRAMCGLFQLSAPAQPEYLLRMRGLDVSRRYRLTWDNAGQSCELDGVTLMKTGLTVRLESALTSELLLFEAIP